MAGKTKPAITLYTTLADGEFSTGRVRVTIIDGAIELNGPNAEDQASFLIRAMPHAISRSEQKIQVLRNQIKARAKAQAEAEGSANEADTIDVDTSSVSASPASSSTPASSRAASDPASPATTGGNN